MTQEQPEILIVDEKPLTRKQKLKAIAVNWKSKIPFGKTKALLSPIELEKAIADLNGNVNISLEEILKIEEAPVIESEKDKKNKNDLDNIAPPTGDLLQQLERQKKEQEKLVNEAIDTTPQDGTKTPFSQLNNPIKSNEIESTISLGLKEGLIEPKNIRHFTDLDSRQVSFSTLGIGYGQSIYFPEYVELFEICYDLSVSKGRKGRTEVKEIGIAGVQRETQSGLMDKLQFWKRGE